jgi:hypothetical protein
VTAVPGLNISTPSVKATKPNNVSTPTIIDPFSNSSNAFRKQEWFSLTRGVALSLRRTPPLLSFLVGAPCHFNPEDGSSMYVRNMHRSTKPHGTKTQENINIYTNRSEKLKSDKNTNYGC